MTESATARLMNLMPTWVSRTLRPNSSRQIHWYPRLDIRLPSGYLTSDSECRFDPMAISASPSSNERRGGLDSRRIDIAARVYEPDDSPIRHRDTPPNRKALASIFLDDLDTRMRAGDASGDFSGPVDHSIDNDDDLIIVRNALDSPLNTFEIRTDRPFLSKSGDHHRESLRDSLIGHFNTSPSLNLYVKTPAFPPRLCFVGGGRTRSGYPTDCGKPMKSSLFARAAVYPGNCIFWWIRHVIAMAKRSLGLRELALWQSPAHLPGLIQKRRPGEISIGS